MWSYLRKLIIGINFSKVWKWLFPQQIAQKTGKTLLTGDFSEFYAELQFEFDDDEGTVTIEEDGTGDLVTGYQDDMFIEWAHGFRPDWRLRWIDNMPCMRLFGS